MENDNGITKYLPQDFKAEDALKAFGMLLNYANVQEAESAKRDVMIAEITHRYKFYHDLLVATFSERQNVINEYFKVIDDGMKNNDNERINIGLRSLTDFVKESPFRNIQNIADKTERRRLLESGELSVI